jgi:hypothetical protein
VTRAKEMENRSTNIERFSVFRMKNMQRKNPAPVVTAINAGVNIELNGLGGPAPEGETWIIKCMSHRGREKNTPNKTGISVSYVFLFSD